MKKLGGNELRMVAAGCQRSERSCVPARLQLTSGFLHWFPNGLARAFTLIEIMVVVAIMGLILATGIPSIYRIWNKEGMRQTVSDVVEACSHARAQAILRGSPAELVFYPVERRFVVAGAASSSPQTDGDTGLSVEKPAAQSGSGLAGTIGEDITIEMLDVNLLEYRESDFVRVRFFPNGTSDEMTLVLRSSKNQWRAISLEVTTGLASVETDPRSLLTK